MIKRLSILICITVLAGIGLGIVAVNFDPYQSEAGIIFLFLSSLFAFIWGAMSLIFFSLNILSVNRWQDSFRRGFLLAVFLLALILLRINDIFYWYAWVGIGTAIVAIEAVPHLRNKRTADA